MEKIKRGNVEEERETSRCRNGIRISGRPDLHDADPKGEVVVVGSLG